MRYTIIVQVFTISNTNPRDKKSIATAQAYFYVSTYSASNMMQAAKNTNPSHKQQYFNLLYNNHLQTILQYT